MLKLVPKRVLKLLLVNRSFVGSGKVPFQCCKKGRDSENQANYAAVRLHSAETQEMFRGIPLNQKPLQFQKRVQIWELWNKQQKQAERLRHTRRLNEIEIENKELDIQMKKMDVKKKEEELKLLNERREQQKKLKLQKETQKRQNERRRSIMIKRLVKTMKYLGSFVFTMTISFVTSNSK